jgi:hypothetical protein
MPRKGAPTTSDGNQMPFPEWEQLTQEQQHALIDILQEAAQELRNQYEEEVNRLHHSALQGRMHARRDGAGLNRQPIPPVPDVKRDGAYEKLALDTHRLVTYLAYVQACLAHLSAQGYDIGVGLVEYLAYRTDSLPVGRVKAFAQGLEQAASASYTSLYTRAVNVFPERAMQRVLEWDDASRQQDSWLDKLRRMLAAG